VVWWMMVGGLAIAGTDTDTGTTKPDPKPTGTDTGVPVNDTVCSVNPCSTASDLAKERGGSPCDDGCDSSGGALPAMGLLLLLGGIRRRR